jgi:RNA ligase (TIGR02306 family)
MERVLASIKRIDEIRPIENADAIECAVLGGWQVVVKKGDFQAGQLAVYAEIDSWIPNWLAPFLSKGKEPREYNGVKGERLKTIRLRGQISQGLLLPVEHNPPVAALIRRSTDHALRYIMEGDDVTDFLGIQKHEVVEKWMQSSQAKGNFPSFIFKTDQERIQNLKREVQQWKEQGDIWEVTEKLDGSSISIFVHQELGLSGVCSRNLELRFDPDNPGTFWSIALKYNLIEKIMQSGMSVAFQGELIGPGIQGNPYGLKEFDLYVYDIFDIKGQKYLLPNEAQYLCRQFGVKHVPTYYPHALEDISLEEQIARADGYSELNPATIREGLVFKNMQTEESFKVISNKFLMQKD